MLGMFANGRCVPHAIHDFQGYPIDGRSISFFSFQRVNYRLVPAPFHQRYSRVRLLGAIGFKAHLAHLALSHWSCKGNFEPWQIRFKDQSEESGCKKSKHLSHRFRIDPEVKRGVSLCQKESCKRTNTCIRIARIDMYILITMRFSFVSTEVSTFITSDQVSVIFTHGPQVLSGKHLSPVKASDFEVAEQRTDQRWSKPPTFQWCRRWDQPRLALVSPSPQRRVRASRAPENKGALNFRSPPPTPVRVQIWTSKHTGSKPCEQGSFGAITGTTLFNSSLKVTRRPRGAFTLESGSNSITCT